MHIQKITIEENSLDEDYEASVFKSLSEFEQHAPSHFDDDAEGRSFTVYFRGGRSFEFYNDGDGWACSEKLGVMRQDYAYASEAIEDLLDAVKSLSMTP